MLVLYIDLFQSLYLKKEIEKEKKELLNVWLSFSYTNRIFEISKEEVTNINAKPI